MGTKHAGIPEPSLRPYLSGSQCPDPQWAAARGLVLQGPTYILGARWVFEIGGVAGIPGPPPAVISPPTAEGSILFVDVLPDPETQASPTAPPEGATLFVDKVPD